MNHHQIDYVPGCFELGDFDPTSTSIAMFPCGEERYLPHDAYVHTFDKYFEWCQQRMNGSIDWEAFTPYEVRNTGTFIYLGDKGRAHRLLEWLTRFQRPRGWNEWAEVVWHQERTPRYIGDMPHTWVGSDFINVFRAMFAYERDEDRSVIVGAGLKDGWVRHGLSVEGLPTHFGKISYALEMHDPSTVEMRLSGSIRESGTALLVPTSLLARRVVDASVDGAPAEISSGRVIVRYLPAVVRLKYQ